MVSIKATAMLIMLLTFCVLATDTSAAYYGCCRSYMERKLPFSAIKGYLVQTRTELCPVSAIIFHTRKGQACANPALDWVMHYVNLLRKKAQSVHLKTPVAQGNEEQGDYPKTSEAQCTKCSHEDLKPTEATKLFCTFEES